MLRKWLKEEIKEKWTDTRNWEYFHKHKQFPKYERTEPRWKWLLGNFNWIIGFIIFLTLIIWLLGLFWNYYERNNPGGGCTGSGPYGSYQDYC